MMIHKHYSAINKLLKYTKTKKIEWNYRDSTDIYFERDKEQYFTHLILNGNKSLDIVLTKYSYKSGFNYFVDYYLNSINPLFNKKVESIYYKDAVNLFNLFAHVKYENYLNNKENLKVYKEYLYKNYIFYKWTIIEGIEDNFLYETNLEKCKFKENNSVSLLVTPVSLVIYLNSKFGINTKKEILHRNFDKKLYNILYV